VRYGQVYSALLLCAVRGLLVFAKRLCPNCFDLNRGRVIGKEVIPGMPIREEKVQVVSEIKERLSSSASAILVDYRGLKVEEVTQLRRKFREAGVVYKVYKNTLIEIAARDLGLDDLIPYLQGPTAIAFSVNDPVAPAKLLLDSMNELKKMEFKVGIVDGKIIDVNGIQALAKLPSRQELIAKMLGSMNAPIANLVGVLSGPMRAFVYALNAIKAQKEA
jgi:large subunit ribosomal protein L10